MNILGLNRYNIMENQNREIKIDTTHDDDFEEIVYVAALIGKYAIKYLCKQP